MARIRLLVFVKSWDGTGRDGTPTKNLYVVRFNRERVASIDDTIGLGLGRDRCRAISIGVVVVAVFARLLRLRRLVASSRLFSFFLRRRRRRRDSDDDDDEESESASDDSLASESDASRRSRRLFFAFASRRLDLDRASPPSSLPLVDARAGGNPNASRMASSSLALTRSSSSRALAPPSSSSRAFAYQKTSRPLHHRPVVALTE